MEDGGFVAFGGIAEGQDVLTRIIVGVGGEEAGGELGALAWNQPRHLHWTCTADRLKAALALRASRKEPMHRNTAAALAALFCLLSGPFVFAARPTRPVRPTSRLAASQPRLRLSRERAGRNRVRNTSARTSSHQSVRQTVADSHRPSARYGFADSRHSLRRGVTPASPDGSSFVARSARAAAERHTSNRETDAAPRIPTPTEVRASLDAMNSEMDADASLVPASRTFSLYDDRGRLIVPAPLRGSREVLLHQNEMADSEGLTRIQDDEDLADLRRTRQLVPLPVSDALRVDERLPDNRRYSRPWTANFLSAMAADFYAHFHAPLQVDSAVRTVQVQQRLERTNGNAAPAEGETASPHLTGQAVDIAKRGLTLAEIAWLRLYLQPLMDAGKIDVEEEFRQACFHISVYRNYMPVVPRTSVAAAADQPGAEP